MTPPDNRNNSHYRNRQQNTVQNWRYASYQHSDKGRYTQQEKWKLQPIMRQIIPLIHDD
jgi:hypothetical protein